MLKLKLKLKLMLMLMLPQHLLLRPLIHFPRILVLLCFPHLLQQLQ